MSSDLTEPLSIVSLAASVSAMQEFARPGELTHRIADLESALKGLNRDQVVDAVGDGNVKPEMLYGALALKRIAGEVNVAIHALGILLSLPTILQPDEKILNLSLGAGNTGRKFDLETNLQVAEFKFIDWQGGPESIRQNTLFVDIFHLAQDSSDRRKIAYLSNLEYPLRFLQGRRAIHSVLSRNATAAKEFAAVHGEQFSVVSEYWKALNGTVQLVDITVIAPILKGVQEDLTT